jgi:hypothetical protein
VPLDELTPWQARKLLSNRGLAEPVARRIVESGVLPRRPLELMLMSEIMVSDPDNSVDEIEAEIRTAAGADPLEPGSQQPSSREVAATQHLATGIIYRRVLQRMRNEPIAQKLAYPGLVLRYLTVPLIQQVLSPVLDLSLSDQDATHALDALARYSWLTYREHDEVWHRKELRHVMVRLMVKSEPTTADAISRRAVLYFEQTEQKHHLAEAFYHRLMLTLTPADGDSFTPAELEVLKNVSDSIVRDEVDLPRAGAVLLQFARDRKVGFADVEMLPRRYFASAYGSAGRELVSKREFAKALRLYYRGKEEGIPIVWDPSVVAIPWEVETLDSTAEFDELPRAQPPVSGPISSLPLLVQRLYPAELIGRPIISTPQLEAALQTLSSAAELDSLLDITRRDAGPTISWLASSLLVHHHHSPLSSDARRLLLTVVHKALAPGPKTLSPILERRLILLCLALKDRRAIICHLAPSILQLDLDWLGWSMQLTSSASPAVEKLLGQARSTLEKTLEGRRCTARRVLAALDALHRDRGRWTSAGIDLTEIASSEDRYRLIRGPDSGFRDSCRYALLDVYHDRAGRRNLAGIISSVLPYPLEDLDSDQFADLLSAEPERGLEVYIELVDRVWSLGKLMKQVLDDQPDARKLKAVSDAQERWDNAVRAALLG